MTRRAQAHTLEGVVAAILVLGALSFALGATAVTPLTASTSNQLIENQQRTLATDLLATTAADGSLRAALLHWNDTAGAFVGTPEDGAFATGGPPNEFGAALNETFGSRSVAFNVVLEYSRNGASPKTKQLVDMGEPSTGATIASRSVPLADDVELLGPDSGTSVSDADYFAPDAEPDGPLYNVVEVRIVVWRI